MYTDTKQPEGSIAQSGMFLVCKDDKGGKEPLVQLKCNKQ
jgi:hypothetical protein